MPFDYMPNADRARDAGFVPMNHSEIKYFEVGTIPVFNANGTEIPGYLAVQRKDTGDTLAVHSDSYVPIQDAQIFEAFENGLDRAGFNLTGLAVAADRSHNGARMFVQYLLPEVTEKINGTQVSLRFLMWNSHDGSLKATGRAGFYNWVCANTAVRGEDLGAFSIKHVGGAADITVKIDNLAMQAEKAVAEMRRMKLWAERPILDSTAKKLFEAIPGSSKQLVGTLLSAWTDAKEGEGPNAGDTLWSAYNVLTGWASHTEGRSKNAINARVEREQRVAKLLALPEWTQLAA
jgi:hypothetical protein